MTVGEKTVYNGQRVTIMECLEDKVVVIDESGQ
jgi:hypothetical protein